MRWGLECRVVSKERLVDEDDRIVGGTMWRLFHIMDRYVDWVWGCICCHHTQGVASQDEWLIAFTLSHPAFTERRMARMSWLTLSSRALWQILNVMPVHGNHWQESCQQFSHAIFSLHSTYTLVSSCFMAAHHSQLAHLSISIDMLSANTQLDANRHLSSSYCEVKASAGCHVVLDVRGSDEMQIYRYVYFWVFNTYESAWRNPRNRRR